MRFALALVCVGASLIIGAHTFGFLIDSEPIELRARQRLSEALAVNAEAHVRKGQWIDLATILQTQVDRNPDLFSVGIRSELGILRVNTGHHDDIWPTTTTDASHVDQMMVPIKMNRRPWGKVELCFRRQYSSTFARITQNPLIRLLSFFVTCGFVAYTFFVVRVLRLFNGTQMVPERVRGALDTLAEGLLILDEEGRIVLANRAFADVIGEAPEELADKLVSDLEWVREDGAEKDGAEKDGAEKDGADEEYPWTLAIKESELQTESILRYKLSDGQHRIFSVNAAPLGQDRSQRGALATFRDVTHVEEHRVELERMLGMLRESRDEIKRKNGELEILATQDALTGCLNRRAFFEVFENLWRDSRAAGAPLACMMIDIDHFKNVNDTYGHHTGDEVLRHTSQVVRRAFKDNGVVCRYGGEEFCIVLPEFDLEQAMAEAEKMRAAITEIRLQDPAELRLSGSVGVSEMRFEATDPQDLINQADLCLYTAKREGRNRVIAYNASMASESVDTEVSEEAKRERIDVPYQAVTALFTTLSYRDANTAEHSRRVADLCARVADGLLDPTQAYVLEIAGLLHDLGKVGAPDEILLKPDALTPDEIKRMARHARVGVDIINNSFDCQALSQIVSNHHAFYGGTAADRTLPVGDDIPLGARLLSIADSYDAMVSDRVYRKGCSHAAAIEELRRCAGTQFDPQLVEHFADKVESREPVLASGALAIRKQAAIQIGHQVQRLAAAVAVQDITDLKTLASQLGMIASETNLESIATTAEKISAEASKEDFEWLSILRTTQDLMDVCRATQSEFLKLSLERGAHNANREAES